MKLSLFVFLLVFLFLSVVYVQICYADKVKLKYLQFSNQSEPLSETPTNFAILESGDLRELPSSTLTIYGSIYIGFYRGIQTFYTMRRNAGETLWFSLYIFYTTGDAYLVGFNYFGGIVFGNTGGKVRLRPHAWSHACTTVGVESGHVTVVINGILTINTTISSNDFTGNVPTVFQNTLTLGVGLEKFIGSPSNNFQSEASVTNVNVFSVPMNVLQMVGFTTTDRWTEGDVVSWSKATWTLLGNVEEIAIKNEGETMSLGHIFKMADGFHRAHDCLNLCPRIQPGGRVPLTNNAVEAEHLAQLFHDPDSKDWFWSSFIYETEGNFTDYYTGSAIHQTMWVAGQPNGGLEQQCTQWDRNIPKGSLFDTSCVHLDQKLQCLCQFDESPILIMRGLCMGSHIDTHCTLKKSNGSIDYMGLTGTVIRFLPSTLEWAMGVNLKKTIGVTSAEETSFILGRHEWSIDSDSVKCNRGSPYISQLKISGCKTDGEFTCNDGQCVTMEQRCDQVPDCMDRSDEEQCQLLVKSKGYNPRIPPFTVRSSDRSIVPFKLNISIDLLKIVDMEETDHKIDFQFEITLK